MAQARTLIAGGAGAMLIAAAVSAITPNIQQYEGTKPVAYKDIGGMLTVCSGHTGSDIVVNKVYTTAECTALTTADVAKAAAGVLKYTPQLKWHTMQLASAISFSYNIGVDAYGKSDVARAFNAGDFKTACSDMKEYVHVKHVVIQGLVNRRQQEYQICMSTLTPGGLNAVGNAS